MEKNNNNENQAFNYTYKKSNKFPTSKKEFFEKAFTYNKTDFDEPFIPKDEDEEEINNKSPMGKVLKNIMKIKIKLTEKF